MAFGKHGLCSGEKDKINILLDNDDEYPLCC